MTGYEQVWKYITVHLGVSTVHPPDLNGPKYSDGFIRDSDSMLYVPVAYDYANEGYVPMISTDHSHIGVLFEVFKNPTPMGKVAVAGIVPMKVGQEGSTVAKVNVGHFVGWGSTIPGIVEMKQGADLKDRSILGIALASGEVGEYVPVLLKEIPDYEWLGA